MGLSSFFKNLFGSTKESAAELATSAENTFEQVKEAAAPYIEKAETFAEETIDKVKEVSEPIIDRASDYADKAKETVTEYAEKATEAVSDVIDSVKEKAAALTSDESPKVITETVVDASEIGDEDDGKA
ncbi:YtxH domain-containing protein [Flavobacterium sp. YJ01]|uniref:YtxH domain-containing protein n=1 Tax=unclassified Flavobacterium TaxID=196869 RepID=UPI0023E3A3A1|nr:YtxH domain-containing protein [Flavobacterium sp. YJ01]WET04540.1 YtxH domain-containing protein [Flavobacterium sp. YJ01]